VDAELRLEAASDRRLLRRQGEEVRRSQGGHQNRGAGRQSQGVRRVPEVHRAASWSGAWDGERRQVHPGVVAEHIRGRLSLVHRRGGRDRRSVVRAGWRRLVAGGRSRSEREPGSQAEAQCTPDAGRSGA
jgi:hypothetical protein